MGIGGERVGNEKMSGLKWSSSLRQIGTLGGSGSRKVMKASSVSNKEKGDGDGQADTGSGYANELFSYIDHVKFSKRSITYKL